MPGPVFCTGQTVDLCTMEVDDVEFLQGLVNDPRVRTSLRRVEPVNRKQEREWVESIGEAGGCHLLVCADGTPVGTIGFDAPNEAWGTAEVGFMIHPDHWNAGYATDALGALCGYAFEERRLEKMVAMAYETNEASRRVLEKTGFTEEGVLREEAFVGGERVDVHRYGLLATEWDGE